MDGTTRRSPPALDIAFFVAFTASAVTGPFLLVGLASFALTGVLHTATLTMLTLHGLTYALVLGMGVRGWLPDRAFGMPMQTTRRALALVVAVVGALVALAPVFVDLHTDLLLALAGLGALGVAVGGGLVALTLAMLDAIGRDASGPDAA